MRSRSTTERPIGPATAGTASKPGFGSGQNEKQEDERVYTRADAPTEPSYGTRPCPGLSPYIPQYPAGMRMLPPTSEPTPSAAPSEASTAPSPPEEPPGECAVDHGLRVRPQMGLELSNASRVCGTFVLAITMAPAARNVTTSCYVTREVMVRMK